MRSSTEEGNSSHIDPVSQCGGVYVCVCVCVCFRGCPGTGTCVCLCVTECVEQTETERVKDVLKTRRRGREGCSTGTQPHQHQQSHLGRGVGGEREGEGRMEDGGGGREVWIGHSPAPPLSSPVSPTLS